MTTHSDRDLPSTVLAGASRAGGAILSAVTATVDAARTAEKPLHPRGEVFDAVLERTGHSRPPTGASWLDQIGTDRALARVSTAIGLPHGWPDFQGLALRVDTAAGWADILLASTGTGPLTRYLLRPALTAAGPALTTLMPYRAPRGPVLIGARSVGERRYSMSWATPQGRWIRFGELRLEQTSPESVSFDPLRFPPPGLDNYRWTARLREPAYRAAQQGRRAPETDTDGSVTRPRG